MTVDSMAETSERGDAERNRHAILLAVVGGVVTAATIGFMVLAQFSGWVAATGIGGLIVFVGISIGGLLGFLFSVPRILTKDNPSAALPAAEASTAPSTRAGRERLLGSNTNLERISEWLTTMLVGVGLTQIGSLDDSISRFSGFLGRHALVIMSNGQVSAGVLPAIGPLLLICGIVCGFIFFYLYTRIYLSPLFQRVERLLSDKPETLPLQTAVSDFNAAAATLEPDDAWTRFAAMASDLSIDDSLSVIQALLYTDGGYALAIELGAKLVATPAVKTARYWFLMAAANGQKHHALKEAGVSEKNRLPARQAVLNAARKAVQLNPSCKKALRAMTEVTEYDNDLQDFAVDKDFEAIVK